MADEITLSVSLKSNPSSDEFSFDVKSGNIRRDQSTKSGGGPGTVDIATSETTIDFGDIATLGYCYMKNLGPNAIDIGPDATGLQDFMRLNSGDVALLRLKPGITMKAQADTSTSKLLLHVLED